MKLNRSAGWLLLTFTPLLMAVRAQQAIGSDSPAKGRVTITLPTSMNLQQARLVDSVYVLSRAVEEISSVRSASLHGSGNITQPMACVVKE